MRCVTPDYTSSSLTQPTAPKRRRTGLVIGLAGAAVVLIALAVVTTLLVTRTGSTVPSSTTSAGAPVVSGIAQPDPSCVQTTGKDHQDLWNANGWWAGRIDGDVKQMNAFAVLSLTLGGHEVDSVWICSPRS